MRNARAKKNRKYAVMVDGEDVFNVKMSVGLAKKLREHSRVPLTTFNPRDGVRVG
jgi:hypothetical protein